MGGGLGNLFKFDQRGKSFWLLSFVVLKLFGSIGDNFSQNYRFLIPATLYSLTTYFRGGEKFFFFNWKFVCFGK